jgi:hypothetical protein
LSSPADVEALADQLSACADALHARILEDLKAAGGGATRRRTRAPCSTTNWCCASAPRACMSTPPRWWSRGSGANSSISLALTVAAAEQIRKIAVIADVAGLVGGLLQLAAAAATGQAAPIVVALEKLGKRVKALDAHSKKPA